MRAGNLSHVAKRKRKGRARRTISSQFGVFRFGCMRFFDKTQNPAEGFIEHGRLQRIDHELPLFARGDKLRLLEQIQVVGDAGRAHRKRIADLAGIQIALPQHFENAPPGLILQGFEKQVH